VLVVDDDPDVRGLVAEALEHDGYRVSVAADGRAALARAAALAPAVVLLDVAMPVLDGPGFVREARRRGLACPVVVMTGAWQAPARAAELGAAAYLGKPFGLDDLLRTVARTAAAGDG
jgi:CheY-like chemotaxis protein